jgi:plasmid stabilization system protein ParE
MAKKVVWTPEALSSFKKILEYLKENWSKKEIDNFIKATNNTIEYISKNPKMFRSTNYKDIHEALVTPHNLLIYKIYPTKIDIITFWDTRRNPKKKKIK